MIRRENRMSRQKFVMFIERVRCLDTGKVGSGLICSEEMIGKWSEGEIGGNVRVGDKVELADVMTRSSVCVCRCVGIETC